jgi:F0F1-type ATP synthase assembly protein I
MGAWQAAALASQFGFAVIGSLVGGVVLGQVIDRWLGTAPAFFLIGLLLGLVLSVYLIYAIYRVQLQPRRSPPGDAPGDAPAPASHRSPRNPPPSE